MSRYQDGSSRSGSSAAATPSVNAPDSEITYTQKLHRISKAKKGKKVHACDYANCEKVGFEGTLHDHEDS